MKYYQFKYSNTVYTVTIKEHRDDVIATVIPTNLEKVEYQELDSTILQECLPLEIKDDTSLLLIMSAVEFLGYIKGGNER